MKRKRNSVKLSFLLPDFLAFNIIHFILFNNTGVVSPTEHQFYTLLIVFNNMSWLICSHLAGIYRHDRIYDVDDLLKRTSLTYVFFALITWLFFDLNFLGNTVSFILHDVLWFGLFLTLSRLTMLAVFIFIERTGIFRKRVVIIGSENNAEMLVEQLERKHIFYDIIGFFNDNDESNANAYPILGTINECLNFCKSNNISEIYSVINPDHAVELYDLADGAHKDFIKFKFVPQFRESSKYKYRFYVTDGLPIVALKPEPLENIAGQLQKRIFDVIFSTFVVVFILSWLVPIIAILIKLESEGPVFFKQYRTGKNNRPFLCLKFRSLKVNDLADKVQVTQNDSRYTKIGKFLRKTNLDELPQFFNVLAGDMSVVGSRPHMLQHTEDFSRLHGNYALRHAVKPGLTGWAQVNGYRGEIKAAEQLINRVDHDLWYIENWSFWLDIQIVLQTVKTTIKGDKNAY